MTTDIETFQINHKEIMTEARTSLGGQWNTAALAIFVYFLVAGLANIIPLGSILVGGPFALGLAIFSLNISRGHNVEISDIFEGFKNFGNALGTYLLMLVVVILGLILLIVPGIMLALGLSQAMFILAEEPQMGPIEILKKSWKMMDGHKWDFFVLGLRFIPWVLLSILTLFIGLLWLVPYIQVTYANYYRALKGDNDFIDDPLEHLVN